MLRLLEKDRFEKVWLLLHVLFALLSLGSKFMVITWFYFMMISISFQLLSQRNTFEIYIKSVVYIMGFEMWSRLVYATPFIPVEIGKYYPLYIGLIAIVKEGKLSSKSIGWWIIILTIPSVLFFDIQDARHAIPFQYLGIVNLAIFLILFNGRVLSLEQFRRIVKLSMYPLITTLSFTFFRAPDYSEFDKFGDYIGRNDLFIGGAAPNQVSTYFGVGFFFLFIFLLIGKRVFNTPYVDKIFMVLFLFQALMTFSRGGVMSAIIAALMFWVVINFRDKRLKMSFKLVKINFTGLVLVAFIPILLYVAVDKITKGSLTLRYTGQSNSVQLGIRELDMDYYTSGRLSIATEEFNVFLNNPILGVGIAGQRYSSNRFGIVESERRTTHWEFTRLLAEHGTLGLAVVIILIFYPLWRWRIARQPISRAFVIAFWFISIATMFHAAMRTVVPPLFFGLGALTIIDDPIKKT